MDTTSISLLARLRQPADPHAWNRFVALYTPLLYSWACGMGLQPQDAADVVQDVFTTVLQKMPQFTYDREKSFRGWLRTVAVNKWRDNRRRHAAALRQGDAAPLADVAVPDGANALWEAEYQQHLVGRALDLMQAEFQPTTWKACWEVVVAGRPVADVAAELGLSAASVYAAKSRVLRRLREELAGMLD
jgi:RNA polymerase sigma-70 factor (ECF subfamily)